MPELWIWLMIAAVAFVGFGILLIVIVQENAHNIDEWWRAIDAKKGKKTQVVGNLRIERKVSRKNARQPKQGSRGPRHQRS